MILILIPYYHESTCDININSGCFNLRWRRTCSQSTPASVRRELWRDTQWDPLRSFVRMRQPRYDQSRLPHSSFSLSQVSVDRGLSSDSSQEASGIVPETSWDSSQWLPGIDPRGFLGPIPEACWDLSQRLAGIDPRGLLG